MDAATLYPADAPEWGADDLDGGGAELACVPGALEMLKDLKRADPDAPIVSYRCELKNPIFLVTVCDAGHGGSCEHVRLFSRQGCTAYRWAARMRDPVRWRYTRCHQYPREESYDRWEKGWDE